MRRGIVSCCLRLRLANDNKTEKTSFGANTVRERECPFMNSSFFFCIEVAFSSVALNGAAFAVVIAANHLLNDFHSLLKKKKKFPVADLNVSVTSRRQ